MVNSWVDVEDPSIRPGYKPSNPAPQRRAILSGCRRIVTLLVLRYDELLVAVENRLCELAEADARMFHRRQERDLAQS
jgi:hypothetical protein